MLVAQVLILLIGWGACEILWGNTKARKTGEQFAGRILVRQNYPWRRLRIAKFSPRLAKNAGGKSRTKDYSRIRVVGLSSHWWSVQPHRVPWAAAEQVEHGYKNKSSLFKFHSWVLDWFDNIPSSSLSQSAYHVQVEVKYTFGVPLWSRLSPPAVAAFLFYISSDSLVIFYTSVPLCLKSVFCSPHFQIIARKEWWTLKFLRPSCHF